MNTTNATEPRKLKTLRGYTEHARFLYECDQGEDGTAAPVGWWIRPNLTHGPVYRWRGQTVGFSDVQYSIRKIVLAIPARMIFADQDAAMREAGARAAMRLAHWVDGN